MTGALPAYAVISPVRDEAEHFGRTAAALVAQTHRPVEWVIVDDGSSDATRPLAEAYAAEHPWISVIDSGERHRRARGAPIVHAFNTGLAALRERPEIVVKMDGDLFLPAHCFAWIASVFARRPRAGIVGGEALIHDGRRWRPERASAHTVRGVVKAYRTACLDDIGGLRPSMGWDGIDEYGARARGWEVHVLSELSILHYRVRGAKQPWYRARWEEGRANHFMGYRPEFMLLRVAYRMLVEPPPLLGGLVLAAAFAHAHARRSPQVDDARARSELRAEQRERLRGLLARRRYEPSPPLPGGGPAHWATGEPGCDDDARAGEV